MVQADRNRPLVPAFGVTLNGESMTKDLAPWVASISIHDEINLPAMFELQLVSRDAGDHAVPWVDDPRLQLGATLELSLGYDARLDTMIVGEITDLEPVFTVGGPPQLVVRGQDRRHRLNGGATMKTFENFKASDIIQIIVHAVMPFRVDPETDSSVEHEYEAQQDGETDLAFIQRLATRIGHELVMDGATLLFRPRANQGTGAPTLTFDDDLFEFSPRMTLLPWTKLTMRAANRKTKEEFAVSPDDRDSKMGDTPGTRQAGIALGGIVEMLMRESAASQPELDQLAAARLEDAALDFIRGNGRCRGRTDVRAGRVIGIDKIGSRFSGPYYVSSAAHSYTPGDGYTTSFQVQRNAS